MVPMKSNLYLYLNRYWLRGAWVNCAPRSENTRNKVNPIGQVCAMVKLETGQLRATVTRNPAGSGSTSVYTIIFNVFSHFVRSRFVRFWVPTCFSAVSGAKKLGSASSCVVLYRAYSAMVLKGSNLYLYLNRYWLREKL
jgi:hypothetical protein